MGRGERGEQEQTKFYDLRRGITKDFQRLAKFHRIYQKVQKRFTNFKRFAFLTFFDLSKLKFDQHNLGVPKILNFMKFFCLTTP